ncbi:MAG: hypothetical protein V7767_14215, partial [Leeuwenhoekiella sp.]
LEFTAGNNQILTFTNPYPENWIRFIVIIFKESSFSKPQLSNYNFDKQNDFLPILEKIEELFSIKIGKFDGRTDYNYLPKTGENRLFTYIIEGAFEIQNRLLEKGEGLYVKDLQIMEMEALSSEAMALLIAY